MKKTSIVICAAILAGGCMNTSPNNAPTHRWESTSAADEVQYRNDHAKCQMQANASGDMTEFEADSPTFVSYKQCMNNRGYVLTAYSPGGE